MPGSRVVTKFADLDAVTASRVLVSDANGYAVAATATAAQVNYLADTATRINLEHRQLFTSGSTKVIDWQNGWLIGTANGLDSLHWIDRTLLSDIPADEFGNELTVLDWGGGDSGHSVRLYDANGLDVLWAGYRSAFDSETSPKMAFQWGITPRLLVSNKNGNSTSSKILQLEGKASQAGNYLELITSTGSLVSYFDQNCGLIGNETGGTTADLRWEGDTETHLLFVDASVDGIGIASSSVDSACYMQFPTSATLSKGLRVPTWTGATYFNAAYQDSTLTEINSVATATDLPAFTPPAGTILWDDANGVIWCYSGTFGWRGVYCNIIGTA